MVDVEHWFIALRQKSPVVGVHAAAPQMQPALLAVVPSVFEQNEPVEQTLTEESQTKPVVGVQAAAPQMHPALLAVVPSVFEQSGPVAQRQG